MNNYLLEMKDITKIYPNGVVANNNVSFHLTKGEIHALAGENGAGKSTLMKILYGLESYNKGEIILNNKIVKITSPKDAINLKIGMVHQHFMLIESLTVAENIMLGKEYTKKKIFLDRNKAIIETKRLSEKYNLHIDPNAKVKDLSVGLKQRLEILKVLAKDAQIIILDEPTAVLTPQETEELFQQLKIMKNQGFSIIIITHKLKEIKALCDTISIMRLGKMIGSYLVKDITEEEISKLMIGKTIEDLTNFKKRKYDFDILKTTNLTYIQNSKKILNNINLRIRNKEILGIAGVEGNGQRTLVDIIVGEKKNFAGSIHITGKSIQGLNIKKIRELSVGHIPEDRMVKGINQDGSVIDNIISTKVNDKSFSKGLFLNRKKIKAYTEDLKTKFDIRVSLIKEKVKILSGGNIQKVVCARELASNPKLLIADQPSRGIDIGSVEFIHKKIIELADNGSAVLLVSADLSEILRISHNIIVMYDGEIAGFFRNDGTLTEEELGKYMLGIKKQSYEELWEKMYE